MTGGTETDAERRRALDRVGSVVGQLGVYGVLSADDLNALDLRMRRGIDTIARLWGDIAPRLGVQDPTRVLHLLYDCHLEAGLAFHLVFHPAEVATRVLELADALGLETRDRDLLLVAALIHDLVQDFDIDGAPHPENESNTVQMLLDRVVPELEIDLAFIEEVSTLIAATKLGIDIRSVVEEQHPGALDHSRLVQLAELLSDADLGGLAMPTSALDNKLLRIEWRSQGAARVLDRQQRFVTALTQRPGGPFRSATANRLWGAEGNRRLTAYDADLASQARSLAR